MDINAEQENKMNIILRRKKLGRTSTKEFSKFCNATPVRNDLLAKKVKEPIKWLIRWGCTSVCEATHTINKAEAISLANNKAETRKILQKLNLPKRIVPNTWFDYASWEDSNYLGPVIVRPIQHAQGRSLYYLKTPAEIETFFMNVPHILIDKGYYISEYIEKEAEYRVFVIQGKVVWVAKKTPADPKAIAWNVAQGGKFENVRWNDWPLRACRIAIQACEALGLDFGGVDIIQKGKEFLILEVNSAPSQTSPYRQKCTGKAFDYLIKNNNQKLDTPEKVNSYTQFIHPGIL